MKDIPGYEGLYAITEDGQVYKKSTGRMTRGSLNKDGYYSTTLTKDGVSKNWLVHRLVALTYIPNPENKPIVNHLDENKANNHISNLEWATAEENTNWGTAMFRASQTHHKNREKKLAERGIVEKEVAVASTLLPREKEMLQKMAKENNTTLTALIQTAIRKQYFNKESE